MPTKETAATGFDSFPHSCQPGSLRLLNWAVPTFGLASAGCLGEDSQLTSGAWSWHKYGKAVDLGCWWYDPTDHGDGDRFWNWVIHNAELLGLQQMIWGNRIANNENGVIVIRYYTRFDHYNHIHVAIGIDASQNWQPPGTPYPPEVEDVLTTEEHNWLLGISWLVLKNEEDTGHIMRALFPSTGGKVDLRLTSRPADILTRVKKIQTAVKT